MRIARDLGVSEPEGRWSSRLLSSTVDIIFIHQGKFPLHWYSAYQSEEEEKGLIELVLVGLLLLFIYMLPTVIANNRRHPQIGAICALNILLGWTMLGWVGAFVWSLTNSSTARYGDVIVDGDPYYDNENPYPPMSPQGQAWARGVAARERSKV